MIHVETHYNNKKVLGVSDSNVKVTSLLDIDFTPQSTISTSLHMNVFKKHGALTNIDVENIKKSRDF